MANKLWGGRFKGETDRVFERFSSSLPVDIRIGRCDVRASKAHCKMLRKQKLISSVSEKRLLRALNVIDSNLKNSSEKIIKKNFEDIHSYIESELVRIAGVDGKKIHTARSRNDQVNQAVRLYCADEIDEICDAVRGLQAALVGFSKKHQSIIIPGMTHLQKAQPVLLAHLMLSYVGAFDRMVDSMKEMRHRVAVCTLGSGAFSGTSIDIDRVLTAKELGLSEVSLNSIDSVGSRDFMIEIAFQLSLIGNQISRMSEDLLIGQMEDVGWFILPESLCTGSSMMPQKRNPDFLELARGASSLLIGNLVTLLSLLKGLPSSYQRDLQWDKKPLFESLDLVKDLLYLMRKLTKGLRVNQNKIERSIDSDAIYATDIAEILVEKGCSFRDSHVMVGKLVSAAEDSKVRLRDMDNKKVSGILENRLTAMEYKRIFSPEKSVRARRSRGGSSPQSVIQQIKHWEKKINASI